MIGFFYTALAAGILYGAASWLGLSHDYVIIFLLVLNLIGINDDKTN